MKLFGKKKTEANNENNDGSNLNPFKQKSDNKDENNNNSNANNNDNANNSSNQNSNNQPDKKFSMKDFYKSAGLYEGIDVAGFMKAVLDGDEDKAAAVMGKMLENATSVALTQSNKLTEAKVATIKSTVVEETKTSAKMDMAVREMNRVLPFTSHEAVLPIAKQVLSGFIDQGLSVDDAVKNTHDYYKEISIESAGTFNLDVRDKGDNSGFGNSRMPHDQHNKNNKDDNSDDEEEDWSSILTSGNQTHESINAQEQASSNDGGENSS